MDSKHPMSANNTPDGPARRCCFVVVGCSGCKLAAHLPANARHHRRQEGLSQPQPVDVMTS